MLVLIYIYISACVWSRVLWKWTIVICMWLGATLNNPDLTGVCNLRFPTSKSFEGTDPHLKVPWQIWIGDVINGILRFMRRFMRQLFQHDIPVRLNVIQRIWENTDAGARLQHTVDRYKPVFRPFSRVVGIYDSRFTFTVCVRHRISWSIPQAYVMSCQCGCHPQHCVRFLFLPACSLPYVCTPPSLWTLQSYLWIACCYVLVFSS